MRLFTPVLLLTLAACGDITLRTIETPICHDYVPDLDEDGFYAEGTNEYCGESAVPSGWVRADSLTEPTWDCDDGDPDVHPEADELCDGVDQNCNRQIDEDPIDGSAWYPDQDGDHYGDPDAEVIACAPDVGYVPDNRDCDDLDPNVNPDMWEVCNAIDDDCNGVIDDDPIDQEVVAWRDADGDGWVVDEALVQCAHLDIPEGWAEWDGVAELDCDDDDPTVNPAAMEEGKDCDACDLLVEDDFDRADGDTVGTALTPAVDWVESRGDIDLNSGAAIMSGSSPVNARILLDQQLSYSEPDLQIRFSFDIGNSLGVLWVMTNAGPDYVRDGIGFDIRGPAGDTNYDRVAVFSRGTEISSVEHAGLVPGTTYYAELDISGDMASATLSTGAYASNGGSVTHTLPSARVDRTPDGQQLKVAIDHNGSTSPRLEHIEILGGERCH